MTVSNRALIMLADALRQNRTELKTRWRRLEPGRQALLVLAHLRKGETYADLACGFDVGTTTVYRYLREALDLLAAVAPTLEQAMEVARGKAYVILDGSLLRIDRVGMTAKQDRPYYSGKCKCHGLNVQVLADPGGRLIWVSPTLPAPGTNRRRPRTRHPRRHRHHRAVGPGRHRLPRCRPDRAGPAAPTPPRSRHRPLPAAVAEPERTSTPPTPASADPANAPMPSSITGRSCAR